MTISDLRPPEKASANASGNKLFTTDRKAEVTQSRRVYLRTVTRHLASSCPLVQILGAATEVGRGRTETGTGTGILVVAEVVGQEVVGPIVTNQGDAPVAHAVLAETEMENDVVRSYGTLY